MDETLIRAQQRELTRTGRYYRHVYQSTVAGMSSAMRSAKLSLERSLDW